MGCLAIYCDKPKLPCGKSRCRYWWCLEAQPLENHGKWLKQMWPTHEPSCNAHAWLKNNELAINKMATGWCCSTNSDTAIILDVLSLSGLIYIQLHVGYNHSIGSKDTRYQNQVCTLCPATTGKMLTNGKQHRGQMSMLRFNVRCCTNCMWLTKLGRESLLVLFQTNPCCHVWVFN